jgi:hypothetical protein
MTPLCGAFFLALPGGLPQKVPAAHEHPTSFCGLEAGNRSSQLSPGGIWSALQISTVVEREFQQAVRPVQFEFVADVLAVIVHGADA